MSVFEESPKSGRGPMVVGVVLLLIVGAAAFVYYGRESARPKMTPERTAREEPAAPATPVPAPEAPRPAAPAPAPPPARKSPAAKPAPAPAPPATAAPTRATLTVDSDISGASVFVDRQFVGNAPITLENVEPGQKQINLVAEGFDGVSRTVDVAAGAQTVSMRFKEVRLDKRLAVTHKHGVGSCAGELVATVDGLRYVTSNAKDAGTIPFAALEQFDVNYLEKNLRVKQRGGRTWNFTNGDANADALFVFQRDVDSARKKLAQGYAPVR